MGHSDADALLHAITDAILGALALGDIGKHFPDTDAKYKDADSKVLLSDVVTMMKERQLVVGNIDCTVIADKPKLSPFIDTIRAQIAELLQCQMESVSVKATTQEGLLAEGIACHAVLLLQPKTS